MRERGNQRCRIDGAVGHGCFEFGPAGGGIAGGDQEAAPMPAMGEGKACEYCEARGLCRRDFRVAA
jgi:hypothetical protein